MQTQLIGRIYRGLTIGSIGCLVGLMVAGTAVPDVSHASFPASAHADWYWTWVGGPSLTNQFGVYGVQGVSSPSNMPGGRSVAASCPADAGRVWVFGGSGNSAAGSGRLSDLWRFDPADGHWTWMNSHEYNDWFGVYGTQGVPASSNMPGAREQSVVWPDGAGGLWLFGGLGRASEGSGGAAYMNDLWRFDAASGNWTWVKGAHTNNQHGVYGSQGVAHALNHPGARSGAVGWTAADGKLWLFGGRGRDAAGAMGDLNDLWRFDPVTTTWAWIKGSDVRNQNGVYGTLGVAAPANVPGGRLGPAACVDASGMFWLYGGYGLAAAGGSELLNDLWMFNPNTGHWTWFKGSQSTGQFGVYGVMGQGEPVNTPGSRSTPVLWSGPAGGLLLFGGYGFAGSGDQGRLNDFWRYDPTDSNWAWLKGANITNHPGVHGVKGVPSEHNLVGARNSAVGWSDASGVIWLFGGYGKDDDGQWGRFNDLWSYPQTYTVSFITDGTPGASFAGDTNQVVIVGADCTPVTAQPPATHHFVNWTLSGSDYSVANPLTISNVTAAMQFTANFALSLTPPDVPGNLSASTGDQLGLVRLEWDAAARAAIYEVWSDTRADGATRSKLAEIMETSYDDEGVVGNVNYYYWIVASNDAGPGDFSAVAHGFPAVPGPMLMVNGMVGSEFTLAHGAALNLDARMNLADYPSEPVDWWVGARARDTGLWYYLNSALQWIPFDGQALSARPVHAGVLMDLPWTPLLNDYPLPEGTYDFWFAVDYPMDGVLELVPGLYLMAQVTVLVE